MLAAQEPNNGAMELYFFQFPLKSAISHNISLKDTSSVTRLGDLLNFVHVFKAFGNN